MESLTIICPFQHKLVQKERNHREASVAGVYRLLLEVRIVPLWIFHCCREILPVWRQGLLFSFFYYCNFNYYYSFSISYFIWFFILFLSNFEYFLSVLPVFQLYTNDPSAILFMLYFTGFSFSFMIIHTWLSYFDKNLFSLHILSVLNAVYFGVQMCAHLNAESSQFLLGTCDDSLTFP